MAATKDRVMVNIADLDRKTKEDLILIAEEAGLEEGDQLASRSKEEVLHRILQVVSEHQGLMASGILETMSEGYGFLRQNGAIRPAIFNTGATTASWLSWSNRLM